MGLQGWKGDQVQKQIQAEMARRLKAAAYLVTNRAKELLSVEGTGVRVHEPGQGRGRNGKTGRYQKRKGKLVETPAGSRAKRVYGAFPSAPGEPPRKQTGVLRGSVTWELVQQGMKATARVGTNIVYGKYLELGTRKMKPRPWLRRALREVKDQIQAIIRAPFSPR